MSLPARRAWMLARSSLFKAPPRKLLLAILLWCAARKPQCSLWVVLLPTQVHKHTDITAPPRRCLEVRAQGADHLLTTSCCLWLHHATASAVTKHHSGWSADGHRQDGLCLT
jgi:hypothetical protein